MDYMPKPLPVIQPVPNAAACCAPLMEAPLSAEQAEELSVRLKAIADPTRLRLLSLMLASPGLGACTCDLTESLAEVCALHGQVRGLSMEAAQGESVA